MGFRLRLALFLVAILVLVQGLTWALVFDVTRRQSIDEGERQLIAAADAFLSQMTEISARIGGSVQILAFDYPLRTAIAELDQRTLLSALRNHGKRVGAARMLLLDLDGNISCDTDLADDQPASGQSLPFPFPELLKDAYERPAVAVVAIDGRAYWMVVVPVYAPQLVAQIAAGIPIDDRLLQKLQRLSALPKAVELAASTDHGPWTIVARGESEVELTAAVLHEPGELPLDPVLVEIGGHEYVTLARRLSPSPGNIAMAAVFGYSLDAALGPFRALTTSWAALVALGLGLGLIGALMLARGIARPLEALALAASQIEAGDYASAHVSEIHPDRRDEVARLSAAFGTMTDAIAEREARIRHQADHDALTGMPNRGAAEATIQKQLDAGTTEHAALLMVGLARLPEIVKTLGHALGDRIMVDASERLGTLAGGRLVARAADGQLLFWLADRRRSGAVELAFRIRDSLAEPYRDGALTIDLAPAIGIAEYPQHGGKASDLLQHAQIALAAAFGLDDPVRTYEPDTDPNRPERLTLMSELRLALDGDQSLSLHYQPKLHLGSGRIEGAEGLVRWAHPRRGPIAPDDFIMLAEETGNIRRLTRWVLAAGIAQAQLWAATERPMRIALNLSARDLDDPDLPRRVFDLLAVHRLPPERIVLEVTESAVMGQPDAAIKVLRELAGHGVEIAIDDFGVGQSSLTYLRRLPIHELKIDKSFVRHLGRSGDDRIIVSSIIDLAHRLGFRVVAEGVEDQAALDHLVEFGCDYAQGFHIARPLTVTAFERFLAESGPASMPNRVQASSRGRVTPG
jgi:diguanylate cyclase (GGDEF)-like protein